MSLSLFRAVQAARLLLEEGHPLARASTVAAAEFGASPEEVARLCAEASARADQMRREAIAADAVALELDAMAAGILQALDRLGGSAAARLPRDWRAPLI